MEDDRSSHAAAQELRAALCDPAGRRLAIATLDSSPSRLVAELCPDLILLYTMGQIPVGRVAHLLRRLNHDEACLALPDAAFSVLGRLGADVRDWEGMAKLADAAFPPMLTRLRDRALRSSRPELLAFGRQLESAPDLPVLVERGEVVPADRCASIADIAGEANSRHHVVRLLEAMASTWYFFGRDADACPQWRARDTESYLENLLSAKVGTSWLFLPPVSGDVSELGSLLVNWANWYSTEPCIPTDPESWVRLAVGMADARLWME
jgi:hypothetical protein